MMSAALTMAIVVVTLVFVSQRVEAVVATVGFTPTAGGTDDVAGAAAADYDITFTAANATATGIDVTFPAGYTIAAPGAAGITSSGCTTPATSEVCIGAGAGNTAITGATAAGQVISIAFGGATDLSVGTVTFRITTGVTNPTTAGAKAAAGFTVATTGGVPEGAVVAGADVTIIPAVAAKLAITGQPSASTVAGVAFATQPIVTVQDAFNNTVTGDTSTVALTLTTGTGVLSGTASMAAVAGVADFTGKGLSIDLVGADKVLTATDGGLTLATTGAFTITVAAANKLAVTTEPTASTVAGVAFATQPIVTVQDAFGNTITTDNSTVVTLTLTTGTGALSGTVTKTAAAGIADFAGQSLSIQLTGADKVLTASGTYTAATTAAFTITNAAANKLAVTGEPSASTVAGVAFATQPIVTVQDTYGNTVTGDTTLVTLTLTTGTGALGGTTSMNAVAGIADFTGKGMNINLVGADKVLTASGSYTSATTAAFTITVAAANKLAITTEPTASTVAGVAIATQPIVTVQDAFGNTVTGDTTLVTLTLTTGTGALGGTTSMNAVAGIADFTGKGMNIDLVGADKVLTASGSYTSATTAAFTITVAAASKLAITGQPSASTVAGVAFATQPIVTVQDAFGNTITTDTSTVTLALTTGTGALSGTASMTAVAGIADFTGKGMNINLVGADKVLTATDGGLTLATTGAFTITHAAAAKLVVTTQPSASTAPSVAFAQQPIVTVQDAFGNTVTSDSSTVVTAALTSGTGTLAGTLTATAANGIADFAGKGVNIDTSGTGKVLTFTAGGLTDGVSGSFAIGAGTAAVGTSTIVASPTSIEADGTSTSTITVQLKDSGGTNLSAGGDTVVLATDLGTISGVTDNADGTYTATLTSGTTTGTATVSGTLNGPAITATATVTLTEPGTADPDPTPKETDGGVTVTVENTETAATSTTVEVALSTTSSSGSAATVTVPAGALPAGTTLEVSSISNLASLETQARPPATVDVTLAFSIKATSSGGAVTDGFNEPVALEFTVDASTLPANATGDQLRLAFWNGLRWVLVDATVTVNADGTATIVGTTDHFTLFAVMYNPVGFGVAFEGELPTAGVGFVTFGGTTAQLETALVNQSCISPIFVTSGGEWIGFIPTVQVAAVNAAFNALFADGIPLGTPMVATGCND